MKIFISYRRADSQVIAGRIRDRLAGHYGDDAVFMDVDSIPFGTDFREHIQNALAQSNALIALIGPQWLGMADEGNCRIHDDNDLVRIEVEMALQKGVPVIPVLVADTKMPSAPQLPESLKNFAFINAAPLDTGRDFHRDVERLIRALNGINTTKSSAASCESSSNLSPRLLPLPDKPSIAVLPFNNMSGDPDQEYFADGMVEDIITSLSRNRLLFVIARNSSFAYKGRTIDVKQVGRELGVRYVLEGSVRKSASRVRITGQLIDASNGAHLWADRFDGAIENVFDLQDQVTANVVGAILPKLEQAEIARARRRPTESLDAYDCYLRGMASLYVWTKDATSEALRFSLKAIETDPEFSAAYGLAVRCHIWSISNGWFTELARAKADAVLIAHRAVAVGWQDAVTLAVAGLALAYCGKEFEAGVATIDRALAINPGLATGWHFSSFARIMLGEPEVALEHEMRALRLSPLDPLIGHMQIAAALAHFCVGRNDEAASWSNRTARDLPNWLLGLAVAAASSALAGRQVEAAKAIAQIRELSPALRISNLINLVPLNRSADLVQWTEGLRRAGMLE
jgi:TolB-like protein